MYLSKHQTNIYTINPTKDKTNGIAENSDLGWTVSNKINSALQNENLYTEEQSS